MRRGSARLSQWIWRFYKKEDMYLKKRIVSLLAAAAMKLSGKNGNA